MRLTCPNCDAKYEVDDNAVPDEGRDVQCSNCGHAWFQLPPHLEGLLQDEAQTYGDHSPEKMPRPGQADRPVAAEASSEAALQAQPRPAPKLAPEPASVSEYDDEYEDADAEIVLPSAPRRPLNEGLKRLLREEVDRETAARQAEGGALETQPDLGLDAPRQAMAARAAPLPEDDEDEEDPTPPAALRADARPSADTGASRRDLLPDIEEINSTLRANTDRGLDDPGAARDQETPEERKRGFRRGFLTVFLIAVLLALLYLYAPKIAARVPAAAGPLTSYVQTVDKGRVWLNGLMERATRSLTGGKAAPGN